MQFYIVGMFDAGPLILSHKAAWFIGDKNSRRTSILKSAADEIYANFMHVEDESISWVKKLSRTRSARLRD